MTAAVSIQETSSTTVLVIFEREEIILLYVSVVLGYCCWEEYIMKELQNVSDCIFQFVGFFCVIETNRRKKAHMRYSAVCMYDFTGPCLCW